MSRRVINIENAIALTVLACFGAYLSFSFPLSFYMPDSAAYHLGAKLLETQGNISRPAPPDYSFVDQMWIPNASGGLSPKYPPVYSLTIAAANSLFGLGAGLYVSPLAALLSLFGLYVLARLLGYRQGALLAIILFSLCPYFNLFGIKQFAHTLSLFFIIWGNVFVVAGVRRCQRISLKLVLVFLGAVIAGSAVGTRYADAVLLIPPLIFILFTRTENKRLLVFTYVLGSAISLSVLALYLYLTFGNPLVTGYGLSGETSAFGFSFFANNLWLYFKDIYSYGLGPSFFVALFAILFYRTNNRVVSLYLCSWILLCLFLYLFYYWQAQVLRFIIPALAASALLVGIVAEELFSKFAEGERNILKKLVFSLMLLQFLWGMGMTQQLVSRERVKQKRERLLVESLRSIIEPGEVIFAGNARMLLALDYDQDYLLFHSALLLPSSLSRLVGDSLASDYVSRRFLLAKPQAKSLKLEMVDKSLEEQLERVSNLLTELLGQHSKVFIYGEPRFIRAVAKRYRQHFRVRLRRDNRLPPRSQLLEFSLKGRTST